MFGEVLNTPLKVLDLNLCPSFDLEMNQLLLVECQENSIRSNGFCRATVLKNPKIFRSSRPEVFCEKGVLRNFAKFTGKRPCQTLFFNKFTGLRPACITLLKKTLAQVFSCEFCEISKNTFFYRTALVVASENICG